jgi:hypothetical protein
VSSFGVVYDPERKAFDWSTFRALARLERKTDQSLERYFSSFVNMCRTACRLPPRKDEGESQQTAIDRQTDRQTDRQNVSIFYIFSFHVEAVLEFYCCRHPHTSLCFSLLRLSTDRFHVFRPGLMDAAVFVEPLTEERAARTLYRIELLRKIREQVRSSPGCYRTVRSGQVC